MEVKNLAIFGGKPVFERPRSTSNLIKPDKNAFIGYLKPDYEAGLLSGDTSITTRLEKRLAELHGAQYCVAVVNGLWGLVLSINELKLKGKKEIIMPSLTYRRMADIAAWLKMVPHFCDVDEKTLGISPETAEKCITSETALIMAPHPIVNLCDVEGMVKLAKKHNIPLLFDSVEASYASINGQRIGSFGDAECFSVHASKFLNGFEGGYITTNDAALADRLKAARDFGISENGEVVTLGINGELIAPHAAMTMACLDDIEGQIEKNKLRFFKYKTLLAASKGIDLVEYTTTERRSFKNIVVRLNDNWPLSREATLNILQKENMVVRPYYYPPLHAKPTDYPIITGDMTNTSVLMQRLMLLPCGEFVSEQDIETIVGYLLYLENNAVAIAAEMEQLTAKQ